jgi:hypothetical protein
MGTQRWEHSGTCIRSLAVASVEVSLMGRYTHTLVFVNMGIYCFYTKINMFLQGSVMAVEFLLLNGAKINMQDADGKTPLHLATELGKNIFYFILHEL